MPSLRTNIKNTPPLHLFRLLKRRKMSFEQFLSELGISNYTMLTAKCANMGIVAPTEAEYTAVAGKKCLTISNPMEGIVVLEPMPVVSESTGKVIPDHTDVVELPKPQRKSRLRQKSIEDATEHTAQSQDGVGSVESEG